MKCLFSNGPLIRVCLAHVYVPLSGLNQEPNVECRVTGWKVARTSYLARYIIVFDLSFLAISLCSRKAVCRKRFPVREVCIMEDVGGGGRGNVLGSSVGDGYNVQPIQGSAGTSRHISVTSTAVSNALQRGCSMLPIAHCSALCYKNRAVT